MKKILITILLLLPSITFAQINVNQGGTGRASFPANTWIYADGNAFQRLQGSSSPYVGFLYATSTTATSTFVNALKIGSALEISTNNIPFRITLNTINEWFAAFENRSGDKQLFFGSDTTTGNSKIQSFNDNTEDELLLNPSGGNVGIGTTSPYAKLSVVGPVVASYFHATSTTATSTLAGGLTVDATTLVVDRSTNFVGFGTTTPTESIETTGSIRITENLGIGGNPDFGGLDKKFVVYGAAPGYAFYNSSGATDEKLWDTFAITSAGEGILSFRAVSDDYTTTNDAWLRVYRTTGAAISKIKFAESGNVKTGFGSAVPLEQFEVNKSGAASVGGTIISKNSAASQAGNKARIGFNISSNFGDPFYSALIEAEEEAISNDTSLKFFTYDGNCSNIGCEKLRITSDGNIGIGTSTPAGKLHVTSGANATTTVEFGSQITTSKTCFNVRDALGAATSFYFVGTAMVVEANRCR